MQEGSSQFISFQQQLVKDIDNILQGDVKGRDLESLSNMDLKEILFLIWKHSVSWQYILRKFEKKKLAMSASTAAFRPYLKI